MGTRRLTGAVPLLLAAVLALAAAALVSPWVRHQLALSFTRQPSGYVELYFADEATARTCPAGGGRLAVDATVRSHLDDTQRLDYSVTVASGGAVLSRADGAIDTQPGQAAGFSTSLRVPAHRAYAVSITLPGRSEHLALHCAPPGAGS